MNKKDFWKGLALNFSLGLIFLSIFYGNLFSVLNSVYFAKGGDGLMMYENMRYHIKYSDTYVRCNNMNYPYGEHVFFTNNQPLISNSIKFLAKHGVDLSDYTVGIVNGLMVFSILAAAILLFLIFWELGVSWIIGSVASVGIAFLSPQLDRFGGHFNLSYVCAIPLFIYLALKFFHKPSWWLSTLISLTAIAAALTHFYLYGFLAIILIFFYIGYALGDEKKWKSKYEWTFHIALQLLLPFIILQSLYFIDSVTDRPAFPWGFLVLRSYPQGVFLPAFTSYGQFLNKIVPTRYVEWEGISYVGLAASIFSCILLWKFFSNLFAKRYDLLLNATPDFRLNLLFWASIAALLYSFGIPFILGLQWLVDYMGPLKQMRGIGRFSWLFYFTINIFVFYWLWTNWKSNAKKTIPTLLIAIALSILYFEAYSWSKNRGKGLENYMPEIVDAENKTPENQWINRINPKDYQAIIPVPYFHIGSENIWIEGSCDIIKKSLISSYHTGLPSMGVLSSRTSISQTCNNLSLMLEPSMNGIKSMHFPSEKPFLLIAAKCDNLTENEKRLIQEGTWVDSSQNFNYYSLPVNAFEKIYNAYAEEAQREISSGKLFDHGTFFLNDSINRTLLLDYENTVNNKALVGKGCYEGKAKKENIIANSTLPNADTSTVYTVSFWVGLFRRDLTPRTDITLKEFDKNGSLVNVDKTQVFRKLAIIDGDWALVEWSFRLHHPENRIQIILKNKTLHGKPMIVDDLLIRPSKTNVYQKVDGGIRKNNRLYLVSSLDSIR